MSALLIPFYDHKPLNWVEKGAGEMYLVCQVETVIAGVCKWRVQIKVIKCTLSTSCVWAISNLVSKIKIAKKQSLEQINGLMISFLWLSKGVKRRCVTYIKGKLPLNVPLQH
ncbi:hypothetical protein [Scytonema sp. NUACC26]|uniref:hypothetical protein n=1 Tax=Scytonema sp. NUACC26 TaxID=3140176 RepID=UPI0038B3B9AE